MRAPTFGQCHSSTWPGAGFLATDEIRSLGKGEQPRLQRSRADLGDIAVPSLAWRLCAKRSLTSPFRARAGRPPTAR